MTVASSTQLLQFAVFHNYFAMTFVWPIFFIASFAAELILWYNFPYVGCSLVPFMEKLNHFLISLLRLSSLFCYFDTFHGVFHRYFRTLFVSHDHSVALVAGWIGLW